MPPNCRSFPDRSRIHLYNRTRNSRESIFLSNTRLCSNNTSQAIQPQFANYNRAKPDIRHRQVQLISNVFMRHRFFHRSTTPFLNWNDSKIVCIQNQIDFFSSFDSRESNLYNCRCFIVSFIPG